jgi:hypothetical protein
MADWDVLALYEPEGKQLHQDTTTGRASYVDERAPPPMDAGQALAARRGMGGSDRAAKPAKAQAPRKQTEDEMLKWAKSQLASTKTQAAAQLDNGPAVRRLADGNPQNGYETELTAGAEKAFGPWKDRVSPGDDAGDYDHRGAFAGGAGREGGHMPDTYKKPNHETFSDESQYAEYGNPGHWGANGSFVPPPEHIGQVMDDHASFVGASHKAEMGHAQDDGPGEVPEWLSRYMADER